MPRVFISKDQLKRHRACSAAYTSVEWSEAEQGLVYSDWEKTIERLMSTKEGKRQLEWLVGQKLVPMTTEEFLAIVDRRDHV